MLKKTGLTVRLLLEVTCKIYHRIDTVLSSTSARVSAALLDSISSSHFLFIWILFIRINNLILGQNEKCIMCRESIRSGNVTLKLNSHFRRPFKSLVLIVVFSVVFVGIERGFFSIMCCIQDHKQVPYH